MCGFTGWVSYDRDLRAERDTLDAMTATMARRGPDDEGVWAGEHAALGHRRLAIIDIDGGAQPMRADTPDGPVVLVYAGETYNFTELRAELRGRGHRFTTASDTEVVLRAYLEWGPALAERLNGMFAFAIWDGRTERLVMVRDRLGVKPFYYFPTPDGVLFGSEPKSILANPLAEPALDTDGLRDVVSFISTPGHGFWAGMRTVEPGTVVAVDRGGIRTDVYWTLPATEHTDDLDTTVSHIRELQEDIVTRQLVADVPLCSLLSGGLDSSALTALAAKARDGRLATFAVGFGEFIADDLRGTSDTAFAREVAAHAGTDHHEIALDTGMLTDPALRERVVRANDVPWGGGDAYASLLLLFQAVRERSTVALSGETADEVFGGYRWTHWSAEREPETFSWLTLVPPRDGILTPELRETLDLPDYVHDRYAEARARTARLPGESGLERRMREDSHLHLTVLLPLLLDRKDRMSMATGLEVRVPYCDHRLIEYVHNVPWAMKTFDGREKSLLRAAVADVLPRSVLDRVKSHYPQTQDAGYSTALRTLARRYLDEPGHRLFDLVDRERLTAAANGEGALEIGTRLGLELALDLGVWLEEYSPSLKPG
ncbi:asparagine synthase (glutamine-hydrolyzing) [Phytomonospora endophytica]|uniref:asparagine synthase (glutamine-hydrolyzing) n=1 Tax=Phytomonospora endophytica TaxID=714109 RepID=A0A841FK12_9ACTN|nr:asparagine synthase (glutamine-hydrolyzing) [Phytomonospora endophytica]MBB6032320.1 asparagine synthase (glutamine-hydrolyzing) [Phytomonospora endophytica]GIG68668.1 asparagine synthetase B [Phytomonospora endophytica]